MALRMIFIVPFTGHSQPCSIRSSSSYPPLSASFSLCESVHVHAHTRNTHKNSLNHKLHVKQDFPTTVSSGLNQFLLVCSHLTKTEALIVLLCFNVKNRLNCSSFFLISAFRGRSTYSPQMCSSIYVHILINTWYVARLIVKYPCTVA